MGSSDKDGPPAQSSSERRRFRLEIQQASINNFASEVRKLAIYATAAVGFFGWTADAGIIFAAVCFGIWMSIQLCAVAIEMLQVYPKDPDSTEGDQP